MDYLISKKQLETILEQSEKALTPVIVTLFKELNKAKKKNKTRQSLLEAIRNLSKYLSIPEHNELYLLELYVLNFREDGDYSNLTKENFVDPRYMRGKVTSNTNANYYTRAQLPFKGSNLEAYWTEDPKGDKYYLVRSYGWYPVYIYKFGQWYETSKRYSSSTSKQMYNANPVEWNNDLDSKVYVLTPDEMKMLEQGKSHDEIMKTKLKKLKSLEPELKKARMKTAKTFSSYPEETTPKTNIKFKVNSVDLEDDKAIVTIDVYDVVKREGGKQVPTPQNYLKGEIPRLSVQDVEERIKMYMREKLKDYIGTRFRWMDEIPVGTKVDFKFNHLKK
jgi:hypothetical protein